MTQENAFFIEILSNHINKKATEKPTNDIDWVTLSYLSRIHQVDGIVYMQCMNFIPHEFKDSFERGYSAALYHYVNQTKESQAIRTAFQKFGLQYYTIKGLNIAQFYPTPPLRTMVDIDFIISDMPSAVRIMHSLGYDGKYTVSSHEWGGDRNGLHFELHDLLVRKNECATKKQLRFFHDFMPYVKDNVLDWNYHYLYLIMHLRKHFMFSGVGIRQFMDIAVLIKYGPKLNWFWIEKQLISLELAEFAHICYSLIESWFGIKAPVNYKKTVLSEEITEKVLRNGVFGFADQSNLDNSVRIHLIENRLPRWVTLTILFLSRVFPDYDTMVVYPGCKFLEKSVCLLPFAWIYRFGYLIKRSDFSKAKLTFKRSLISIKTLDEHADRIEKMGLHRKHKH